ncbi:MULTISPECIES: ATP-binding protein [unclassified Knoellia]|uniref:ATP-binding protein n=1 Tax=Knoellia altitudinis TaxID=3404795 RepID=UPI00361025F3
MNVAALTVTQRLRRLVFILVGLMLLAVVTGTVAVLGAYRQVDDLATLNGPAADANASILQILTDAETGLRGYDGSRDQVLLEPFNGAQRRVTTQQQALRRVLDPELPRWSERLATQDRAIAAWWDYANDSRSLLATRGTLDYRGGKRVFDEVRAANAAIGQDLTAQRIAARRASTGQLRDAVVLLAGGALLATVIALYAGWRIARSLTGSIDALRQVVHAQSRGDRTALARETSGPRDVRELAAHFNHLTSVTRSLEADQQDAIRMQEVTLSLATRLRGRVEPQEALAITAEVLAEATSTTAAIFTAEPTEGAAEGRWRLAASWPPDVLDGSRVVLVPPVSRESIARGHWVSGTLLMTEDLARDPMRHQPFVVSLAEQLPIGAFLGTPLGVGDGVIGGILLISPTARSWTPHERSALQQATAYTARSFLTGERVRQQAQLVERLEALDRQKDEFVGTVSHELRTPLTSIAGYLEMLEDGDLGELSPAQVKALGVIDRNTVRLRGLIEDVLVLNRIETRGLDPSFVPVDIGSLVADVVQDLQPQATANSVRLEVLAVPGTCILQGDPLQLGRALTNVIGNAVKFSRTGGTVSVAAVVEATRVRIQCRDEGIGIPEADMAQMFSRFFRASNATEHAIPGTGLGLAIVRAIIDAHHGELELQSVEGEGTTVVMVLPLTTPAAPEPERTEKDPDLHEEVRVRTSG